MDNPPIGLLNDYSAQAVAYDQTRGASRAIVERIREALVSAPGKRLIDIGGGTGNYALALAGVGFRPVVVDRSPEMLRLAVAKKLKVAEADAADLPFSDESFDAALLISMLHHVDDPAVAISEACRVLAPGGVLVALVFTREDAESLWVLDRFPSSRAWMAETHRPVSEYLRELPGGHHRELALGDIADASLAALSTRPDLMLEPAWRSQTSYFERMQRDHPDELAKGLERLEREVAEGIAPNSAGRASLLTWVKPGR